MKSKIRRASWSSCSSVIQAVAYSLLLPLAVAAQPSCNPPAAGLAGWWPGEGSGADIARSNDVVVTGDVSYGAGEVGQCFSFGGVTGSAVAPASTDLAFQSLTIEGWILPLEISTWPRPIVEYGNATGPCAMNFWYNFGPDITGLPGAISAFFRDPNSASIEVYSPGGLLVSNRWSHVAVTFDAATMAVRLYHNGVNVGVKTSNVAVHPASFKNVNLGYRPEGSSDLFGGRRHLGKLDEMSIYTRALSAAELQAIYDAGSAGKCTAPLSPFIISQPVDQTVPAGTNVTLSVVAGGTAPLSYQWSLNGSILANATMPSLDLVNVTTSDAGAYAVLVTNQYGSVPSSNAVLTVVVTAPTIQAQPQSQTVVVGGTATFNVSASGSAPLAYQWFFGVAALGGATSSSLVLTNMQFGDAGAYSVVVSNSAGSATSSNAILTVHSPQPCVEPPVGLAGWWAAEGSGADSVGANNAVVSGDVTFAPGKVGQAFNFGGLNGSVVVAAATNLAFQSLTIEGWILPLEISTWPRPIVEYGNATGPCAMNFWYNLGPNITGRPGAIYAFFRDPGGASVELVSPGGLLASNQWSHVAVTFDAATMAVRLYHNGVNVGVKTSTVPLQPQSFMNVNLGYRPTGSSDLFGGRRHLGKLDEVSIYVRPLSESEIGAIYNAGTNGKCATPVPPFIVTQPSSQAVQAGANVTLNVGAGGTAPLSYQWRFDGADIPGATDPALVLSNVQLNQSGDYVVVVTNVAGAITSSVAALSVTFPPALVRAGSLSNVAAGGSISLPVDLVANGNENALGFSVNFDPTLLGFAGATLGSGGTGATLLINSSQTGSGLLGLALALPGDVTIPAGTHTVVLVNFATAVVTNDVSTTVTFGDVPTGRQLSDAQSQLLPANYAGGTVSILGTDLEGDVTPRPKGDRTVRIADWVLLGRYAARLDYPTNAPEFQRADCAPRSTLGDGAITVTDWVQAGRYAVGLDPLTAVGGPDAEAPGPVAAPGKLDAGRQVRIAGTTLNPSQTGNVSVTLEAQGDENALGFSLSFDASKLGYVGASLGNGAAGATLIVNSSQASSGKLGCVLALGTGSRFSPGSRGVVLVSLRPLAGAVGAQALALGDALVPRQISDTNATALSAVYIDGVITVNPPPSLRIGRLGNNVILGWPLWASNYALQQSLSLNPAQWSNVSASIFTTTNENTLVLPLPQVESRRFYRLFKP